MMLGDGFGRRKPVGDVIEDILLAAFGALMLPAVALLALVNR